MRRSARDISSTRASSRERIAPLRGKFVASPGYLRARGVPRTPEDLRGHEALMQGSEVWRVVSQGRVATVNVSGRFKADNGEALLAGALAGLGIAMLPDFLIEDAVARGALVPVLPEFPPPEAGVYVIRPPGGSAPRKVRELIEVMTERLGQG